MEDGLENSPAHKKRRTVASPNVPPVLNLHRSLKVSNLPSPFMELSFKSFLERLRLSKGIASDMSRAIIRVLHFPKDDYAYVEFPYGQIVTQLVALRKATFQKNIVEFDNAIYEDETMLEDMTLHNLTTKFHAGLEGSTPTKKVVPIVPSTPTEIVENMMEQLSPFKPKAKVTESIPIEGMDDVACQIKVTGLKEGFDMELLLFVLNREVRNKFSLSKTIECVRDAKPEENNAALVELMCVEWADHLVTLKSIDFNDYTVHLAKCTPIALMDGTNKVKVTGLKEGFDMELLLFVLNREVRNKFSLSKTIECVRDAKPEENNAALVELVCDEWADHLVTLKSIDFNGYTVNLAKCTPFALMDDTNKVKVTGLKKGFDLELLLFVLNRAVRSKFSLPKSTECVCDTSLEGENAALVELVCDEWADHLVTLRSIDFNGYTVNLSKNHPFLANSVDNDSDVEEEEDSSLCMLKDSCHVKIIDVPKPLDKDDLCKFISQKMVQANFFNDQDDCVVKCFESGTSCIMKFRTCEEANLACLLQSVVYKSLPLKIVKYCVDKEENILEGTPLDVGELLPLNSDHGKLVCMQMLIMHRDSFPKSGSHDNVLQAIRKKLLKKNVQASLAELRAFRQNLLRKYRFRKRDGNTCHALYVPCSVIFDGANKELLAGTKYDVSAAQDEDEDEEKSAELEKAIVKYSSVASWSTASSTALVQTLIDNQDDFWKPIRKSNFWRDVSSLMLKNYGYPYSESQCENHLSKTLKPALKDYLEMNQSGSAGVNRLMPDKSVRDLMDLMYNLMGHCHSVQPKKTFSVGYSTQERSSKDSGSLNATQKSGLNRPTFLKKKTCTALSLKERKVRSEEMKAKALMMLASSRVQDRECEDEQESEFGDF